MELFGGHPFLTGKAFLLLVKEKWNWNQFKTFAVDEQGQFADHLSRYQWMIQQDVELREMLGSELREREVFGSDTVPPYTRRTRKN